MLPSIKLPKNNISIGISRLFNIDLNNYNILREFSFLIPQITKFPVNNFINQSLAKLSIQDSQIPQFANNIIQSCIDQCNSNNQSINLYGIEFSSKSFENLSKIYNSENKRIIKNSKVEKQEEQE